MCLYNACFLYSHTLFNSLHFICLYINWIKIVRESCTATTLSHHFIFFCLSQGWQNEHTLRQKPAPIWLIPYFCLGIHAYTYAFSTVYCILTFLMQICPERNIFNPGNLHRVHKLLKWLSLPCQPTRWRCVACDATTRSWRQMLPPQGTNGSDIISVLTLYDHITANLSNENALCLCKKELPTRLCSAMDAVQLVGRVRTLFRAEWYFSWHVLSHWRPISSIWKPSHEHFSS